MKNPKKSKIDLDILFREVNFALDNADFTRAEQLCDELIEATEEICGASEKSQNERPINRQ